MHRRFGAPNSMLHVSDLQITMRQKSGHTLRCTSVANPAEITPVLRNEACGGAQGTYQIATPCTILLVLPQQHVETPMQRITHESYLCPSVLRGRLRRHNKVVKAARSSTKYGTACTVFNALFMFGANTDRNPCPWLENARNSVEIASPTARHSVRLKAAA